MCRINLQEAENSIKHYQKLYQVFPDTRRLPRRIKIFLLKYYERFLDLCEYRPYLDRIFIIFLLSLVSHLQSFSFFSRPRLIQREVSYCILYHNPIYGIIIIYNANTTENIQLYKQNLRIP